MVSSVNPRDFFTYLANTVIGQKVRHLVSNSFIQRICEAAASAFASLATLFSRFESLRDGMHIKMIATVSGVALFFLLALAIFKRVFLTHSVSASGLQNGKTPSIEVADMQGEPQNGTDVLRGESTQ